MFEFFAPILAVAGVIPALVNRLRTGVSIDIRSVPMRNGDDDLIFDVCIDEKLGKHTRVEGVRVTVEDQSAREYEYRVAKDRRFPPFNLDPRAGIALKVIAKFEQKLPTSGDVVVVAEVPGRRDGRVAFSLPSPPTES